MLFIILIACCILMHRVAEMEDRNGMLWAGITFLICMLTQLIPLPFINLFIGVALSFILMTVLNVAGK